MPTNLSQSEFDGLDGLITPEIGQLLYEHASRVPGHQSIVEIGSFRGMSTVFLAAGARDGQSPQVYAVDPWRDGQDVFYNGPEHRGIFDAQLQSRGLAKFVIPVHGFSVEVAERFSGAPVGLLYIDGDHSEQAVLDDFHAWSPHLASDATIVVDDYADGANPEVRPAVDSLVAAGLLDPVTVVFDRVAVTRLAEAVD